MKAGIEMAADRGRILGVGDLPRGSWGGQPDRAVARDLRGRELTAGELIVATEALADELDALSGSAGLVAVTMPPQLEAMTAVFGVLRSRHALVMIHPAMPETARLALLRRTRPVAELVLDGSAIRVLSAPGGPASAVWSAPQSRPDLAITLCILTSGSTGRPRIIAAPQRQVLTACRLIQRRLGYRRDDVVAAVSPFSFDFGLYQLLLAAASGASLVVDPSLGTAHGLAAAVARRGITVLPVVPSMLRLAVGAPTTRRIATAGVRLITTTGDLLTEADVAAAREAFPRARIVPMYGLSECKRVAISPEGEARPSDAVGLPLDETDVAIDGRFARRLAPEIGGELVVAGPHLTLGYLDDPDATALRFQVEVGSGLRVLRTGDRLRRDEAGWLYWIGRGSDLIKSSGFRLHPAEVESAAAESGLVVESAAYGREDAERGQRPVLAVRLRENAAEYAAAELATALRTRLPPWALPEIEIRDEALPRTANGKIDRDALRRCAEGSAPVSEVLETAPRRMPLSLADVPTSRQFINCHTQALLSAYSLPFDLTSTEFEVLTTCPFGVRAQEKDVHRLLIPYLDPDLGLDRACRLLGLRIETVWHEASAGPEALRLLGRWLRTGPVLLGPLDLGALPYHETASTLHGCDHYVVALGRTESGMLLRDPEGFVGIELDERSLLTAWAATSVPEGRGAFILRRLVLNDTVGAQTPNDLLARAADMGLDNVAAAARRPDGGSDAFRVLAGLAPTSARRRSLSFLLPAASVRYQVAAEFARRLALDDRGGLWQDFADVFDAQVGTLASAHRAVLTEESPHRLFAQAAKSELEIERLVHEMRSLTS